MIQKGWVFHNLILLWVSILGVGTLEVGHRKNHIIFKKTPLNSHHTSFRERSKVRISGSHLNICIEGMRVGILTSKFIHMAEALI